MLRRYAQTTLARDADHLAEALDRSCLLLGRWMRLAVWLLAGELIGILSPLALLPSRLFNGPHNAPTLEGQYVLKDVIIVGAALVLIATLSGARLAAERDEKHAAV